MNFSSYYVIEVHIIHPLGVFWVPSWPSLFGHLIFYNQIKLFEHKT
jgi:hypothetical protein